MTTFEKRLEGLERQAATRGARGKLLTLARRYLLDGSPAFEKVHATGKLGDYRIISPDADVPDDVAAATWIWRAEDV